MAWLPSSTNHGGVRSSQDGAWDIAAMGAMLLKPVTLAFAAAVKAGQSVLNEAASLEKTTGCTSLKPSCAALEEEP